MTLGSGAAIAPGASAAGRRGARRPGRARRSNLPPVEAKVYVNPRGGVEEDYPLDAHTRNFLDCIKSRQKPNAEMEIGYYAALPCLLALESLQGRQAARLGCGLEKEQKALKLEGSQVPASRFPPPAWPLRCWQLVTGTWDRSFP